MATATVGFQAYVAAHMLGYLPWKRRYLLFGPKVAPAAAVIATFKAIFLMTGALGRATPELVRPILKASSEPGGDAYAFACERTLELMNAASGEPRSYEDLFPDDAELSQDIAACTMRKALPFHFSFMLAQVRAIEGLVLGSQYPDVSLQLLESEITEGQGLQREARQFGLRFTTPSVERVLRKHGLRITSDPRCERAQDVHQLGSEFLATWMEDVGLTAARLLELPEQ